MGFVPRLTLTAVAVVSLAAPALAEGAAVKVLQVRELRGAIAPNPSWSDVKAGAEVNGGDTLKTGPGGAAELLLEGGAHLVMGDNTLVRLQTYDGAVSPRVLTGRVRFVAPPAGSVSIIAGDYYMAGSDGEAIVERARGAWTFAVVSGKFQVGDGKAFSQTLEAGKVLTAGGAEPPAVAALSRSKLQDLEAGLRFGAAPAEAARPTPPKASAAPALPPVNNVSMAAGANRWVATGLSTLLPGTGQVYAGELPRGLVYLGLNGALMGVGYYARSSGQTNLANAMAISLIGLNVLAPIDAYLFTPEAKKTDTASR